MTTKKAQPQKRGVKGYYTGSRLVFLEGYRDEYTLLRGKNRHQFWHEFYNAWWKKYPWRLGDEQEPPTNDLEKMRSLSYVGGEKDVEEKAEVEAKARERIAAWFSYRASINNSHREGGVWTPILKHLHKQLGPKPRCRSLTQQLMHEEPMVVNAAFVSKYGEGKGMSNAERLNKRNEVAKLLVTTTFKEKASELERRAKEAHEQDLKEWGLELGGVEEAEDVALARDSLFSAVHPLLKLIGHYSGCYVTLLAAAPDHADGKPYFSTVHYFPQDKHTKVNWTEFNEPGFKDGVARPFAKYINWMENPKGQAISTTTVPTSSLPPPAALPKPVPTSPQPGKYKKRPFAYTEDSSEDEEVNMELESNDSSGSSVDSDHVPAKRLRSSTIVTRRSKSTPTSKGTIEESDACCGSPSNNSLTSFDKPENQTSGTDANVSSHVDVTMDPTAETEPNIKIPGVDAIVSSPNTCVDTTADTAPTPRRSPATDMGINESGASSETNTTGVGVRRAHKPTKASVPSHQPLSPPVSNLGPELEIPNFLTKNNIYGYLSGVGEAGFHDLLKIYVTFELANHSSIRGVLPTVRRPKAIAWWTGRARPSKTPPFDSLKSFTNSIVQWWVTIQPRWRKIEPGKTFRDEGDWENLYQPGLNGLLNVVILARWWAGILGERGNPVDETYSWFVSDVTWVLSQLTNAARERIFDSE